MEKPVRELLLCGHREQMFYLKPLPWTETAGQLWGSEVGVVTTPFSSGWEL